MRLPAVLFIIAALATPALAAQPSLRDLAGDNGKLLELGLLTANQAFVSQKEKLRQSVQKRYGMDFTTGNVRYDETTDVVVIEGRFIDPKGAFTANRCKEIFNDARQDINGILDNPKIINPFLQTYSLFSGNELPLPPEAIAAGVKQRLRIHSTVELPGKKQQATCSTSLTSETVQYDVQQKK